MSISSSIQSRVQEYCRARAISTISVLGESKDGCVWRTSRFTALKVHDRAPSYRVERDAYKRLTECELIALEGFQIPIAIDSDDRFLAIEMTVVSPPFIVDFASARFDSPPDLIEDEGHTFEDMIFEPPRRSISIMSSPNERAFTFRTCT